MLSIILISLSYQLPALEIVQVNGSEKEQAIQNELQMWMAKYDLIPWYFTKKIRIDENTRIPHSHPVLTLNTRSNGGELLATFIHEQLHWWIDANEQAMSALNTRMKAAYPDAPKGRKGGGARDHASTIMHLTNCYLEYRGLVTLLGDQKARKIISDKGYYRWIYNKVLTDTEKIAMFVTEAGMIPPRGNPNK